MQFEVRHITPLDHDITDSCRAAKTRKNAIQVIRVAISANYQHGEQGRP